MMTRGGSVGAIAVLQVALGGIPVKTPVPSASSPSILMGQGWHSLLFAR